jgi:hypothetical protein
MSMENHSALSAGAAQYWFVNLQKWFRESLDRNSASHLMKHRLRYMLP